MRKAPPNGVVTADAVVVATPFASQWAPAVKSKNKKKTGQGLGAAGEGAGRGVVPGGWGGVGGGTWLAINVALSTKNANWARRFWRRNAIRLGRGFPQCGGS